MYRDMSFRLQGEHTKGSVEHKRSVLRFYTVVVRQDHPLLSYMAGTFWPPLPKACTCAQVGVELQKWAPSRISALYVTYQYPILNTYNSSACGRNLECEQPRAVCMINARFCV